MITFLLFAENVDNKESSKIAQTRIEGNIDGNVDQIVTAGNDIGLFQYH